MRADLGKNGVSPWSDAMGHLRSFEAALRRTARRYSLCADDADDAYQRAVEILLTKSLLGTSPLGCRW